MDLADRRLYLCTPNRPDLEQFLAACIQGGVDVVQLREKHLDAKPLIERAHLALRVCRGLGVPFIVNDRPDIALEVGADGVHVGQDDVSAALCRRILGPDPIVGLSTHSPSEWDAAVDQPVDYLAAGPVHHTATHPDRTATGFDYLRHAATNAPKPWFVTGGANPDTVGAMAEAGANRFVAVRWLTEASDPEAAARALREAIERAVTG
jgi:thiamine-phosphate pyrophosphorylase